MFRDDAMKRFMLATTAIVAATGAYAGGIDRSGQGIGFMFETGTYAELSFGVVSPSVSNTPPAPPLEAGDVSPTYRTFGAAYKRDLTDSLSIGVQIDEPYGAHVQYPTSLGGGFAELWSNSVNVIGRYKFDGGFSAHAGLRYVTIDGTVFVPASSVDQQTFGADSDVGYLAGVAYERPDIALRVALTYFSGTDHSLDSSRGTVGTINPPQAINLDFQTGVAANTLVFGQIRWVDWTDTRVVVPPANPLISYDDDRITYTLGVARKFNDSWSGAFSVGYEEDLGTVQSTLSPTDGFVSVGLAAIYTTGNMKITTGVRYVDIGNATTTSALLGRFEDNDALAVGVKVGWSF
jgi:long-chain fatty acid transport protein